MNSVAETLRAARAKIEDPKHWTKEALARTSRNAKNEVDFNDPKAGAWCALGAISAVDGPFENDAIQVLCRVITGVTVYGASFTPTNIWEFNDAPRRRHSEILRKFDEAIALAESGR